MIDLLKNPNIVRCIIISSDVINEARLKVELGIIKCVPVETYLLFHNFDKRGFIFQYENEFHSITWKQYDSIRKTKAL